MEKLGYDEAFIKDALANMPKSPTSKSGAPGAAGHHDSARSHYYMKPASALRATVAGALKDALGPDAMARVEMIEDALASEARDAPPECPYLGVDDLDSDPDEEGAAAAETEYPVPKATAGAALCRYCYDARASWSNATCVVMCHKLFVAFFLCWSYGSDISYFNLAQTES